MRGVAHDMPFGAQCLSDGNTRFRLWAPAADTLKLVLEESGRAVPMDAIGGGWFELVSGEAPAGSRYRFELPDGLRVPDPASRRQDGDVHDASVVIDPTAYAWRHLDWRGRPWSEAVLYEIHVGTFSAEGNFEGVRQRLRALAELGITAIELMPVADFPGRWNWGYDGVLLFAPDSRYGTPEDLKRLVDSAHELGIMVFLDVVYNHFGPEGNYLDRFAPQTFTDRRTPWGRAIDWSCGPVRQFFEQNAAYWIEEYRMDGLRLDAVHTILDDSQPHLLERIASAARNAAGPGRQIHLVLENDNNAASLIGGEAPGSVKPYSAQWNDDFHHAAHVVLTGETAVYYADYRSAPTLSVGRALAEGFVYQGEYSDHRKCPRGERTEGLSPLAFVNFLQNHDQVGNRGLGERLSQLTDPQALRAMSAALLLAPSIPLLFMGEEHAAPEPFLFFVDFPRELARAVRQGRQRELSGYPGFQRQSIPDPTAPSSYRRSVIDWARQAEPLHAEWLKHYRILLSIRAREIAPRLANATAFPACFEIRRHDTLQVTWELGTAEHLTLLAHVSAARVRAPGLKICGRPIWTSTQVTIYDEELCDLEPWFVGWFIAASARSSPSGDFLPQ